MKALPLSSSFKLLKPEDEVLISLPGSAQKLKISSIKEHGRVIIFSFHGVNDPEAAKLLRGAVISGDVVEELEEGEFRYEQIIGLTVITADGNEIGAVSDIFETGSNDVYVVRKGEKEFLIPAIKDVIKGIDLTNKKIIIQVMPGLLD